MSISEEQVTAAVELLFANATPAVRQHERPLIRAALEAAAKVAPVGELRAFAVTDELVDKALQAYEQYDPAQFAVFSGPMSAALKAVSAHLAAQAEKQAPEPHGDWTKEDARRLVDYMHRNDDALSKTLMVLSGLRECFPRKPQPASEPELVAKAFELTAAEEHAFEEIFDVCKDGHDAYIADARGALDRAIETLGPTEREKELERALTEVADALGYVNHAEGTGGYERIDNARLIQEVRRLVRAETELSEAKGREELLKLRLAYARSDAEQAAGELMVPGKSTPAPAGVWTDALTYDERSEVEHWRTSVAVGGSLRVSETLIAIIDRIAPPKPADGDPLRALLAKWRGNYQTTTTELAALELEEALKAREEHGNG